MLTDRFDDAFRWAHDSHRCQVRKQTPIPYISHLMAVAARVLEAGGDEDQAIAGLLHDLVEDTETKLDEVEARFGPRVASIVDSCTDAHTSPKPPWRERKEAYLAHLADPASDPSALLVAAADKLHNARAMLRDLRTGGEEFWKRFKAPVHQQEWYFRSLVRIFRERLPGPLSDELAEVVDDLFGKAPS